MKDRLLHFGILLLLSMPLWSQLTEQYEVKEIKDIYYIDDSVTRDTFQTLHLALPMNKDNAPVLIWIGGGAWSYGNKNLEMDFANKVASHGIAVANIGHRMSPAIWRDPSLTSGIQHPNHAEDVAAAVKWLFDNALKYSMNRNRMYIGGYSSGGHLAALIGLDKTYLDKHALNTDLFKGLIPISGTYDIHHYHKVLKNGGRPELAELHVEAVFGDPETNFSDASPVNYLDNLLAPILLISDNDMYDYSKLFEDALRTTEFREVQVHYAYHLSHGALWRELSFSEQSIYRDLIIRFIEEN
ncbi:alpha/beta hydrolase [Portibacter marinus]|uniref:alpha/beta hydrolase n=1 Tax=Portibacter marinus TaxID=2898660 RepID=UPI001F1A6765|nr:alpha/beta hydrolase [Portibacter marinus]